MKINYAFSIQSEDWLDENLNKFAQDISNNSILPNSLSKEIIESRKGVTFLKCPAHTDFLKNTFVFKSPIDIILDIEITEEIAKVYTPNLDQKIFEKIIDIRFLSKQESGLSFYPIIGIDFLNLFISQTPVLMSVFPAFLHYNDFTQKTSIIPGQYDISRWVRPVECVFEIKKMTEQIVIKQDDAICYFQFHSPNDDKIKLEKITMPWKEIDVCANLRKQNPFRPLKYRYKSLEEYKQSNI